MTSPLTVLRQVVVWPFERALPAKGRHRAVLLPDEPIPAPDEPVSGEVLDEGELQRLLCEGAAEVLECASCPCCGRITAHAMRRDGSRRCWTCGTETAAGDAG